MKNYFFATSVVLVFVSLSGCDDPGDQVVSGDAGVVAKVSDAGVVAKVSDTGTAVSDPPGLPPLQGPDPGVPPRGDDHRAEGRVPVGAQGVAGRSGCLVCF